MTDIETAKQAAREALEAFKANPNNETSARAEGNSGGDGMNNDFKLGFEYGRAIERKLIALKAFDGMSASVDIHEEIGTSNGSHLFGLVVKGVFCGLFDTANDLCDTIDKEIEKQEETMFDFELEEDDVEG